jgi:hypothetical protein
VATVVAQVKAYLEERLAVGGKLAVVLDIDETTLSNLLCPLLVSRRTGKTLRNIYWRTEEVCRDGVWRKYRAQSDGSEVLCEREEEVLEWRSGVSSGRFAGAETENRVGAPEISGNPQTHNSYSYTANNPLKFVDKEGEWIDTVIDIAAIAYGGYKLGQAVVSGGDVRGEAINFGLDAGGVFIPGVAGLGTLRRIEKAADIAGDAGNTLGNSPPPDSALVCRGGSCSAQRFKEGAGVTIDSSGKLSGVSVNSAPGKSLEELTVSIPHKQVGVTTVGKIRQAGGDVITKPRQNNPVHSELSGITPKQAEQLFTPTKRNPNIK